MINYKLLGNAITYYESLGYQVIDLPWTVYESFIDITKPPTCKHIRSDVGPLIGSAEQSFLYKACISGLKGKYIATTPCFRDENKNDELHQQYFMKSELFQNVDLDKHDVVQSMISDALGFFNQYFPAEVIKIEDGSFDIVDSKFGIEVGSYGIREHNLVGRWAFGTAAAEPRISYVLNKINDSNSYGFEDYSFKSNGEHFSLKGWKMREDPDGPMIVNKKCL